MTTDADRELLAELRGRRTTVAAKLEKLASEVAALDRAISAFPPEDLQQGAPASQKFALGPTGADHRDEAVWESVRALLRGQNHQTGMTTGQIAEALRMAGREIKSATPVNVVFSAVSRRPDVFVKLKRGVWGLREHHPHAASENSAEGLI